MNIALDGNFNFTPEQIARLEKLGNVTKLDEFESDADWVKALEDVDVLCCWGDRVLNNVDQLKDMLITYPYTELGSFDSTKLKASNVQIANAQGGNKMSIVEWTMFSILSLYRKFPTFLRTTEQHPFTSTNSLEGQTVLIVGNGTIGQEVAKRCESFGMSVEFFNRGDDLKALSKKADVVVNSLNCNPSSENLLDADFFANMKPGSFYVTYSRPFTYDIHGLIAAIESDVVAGAAIDCDPEPLFDISNEFYKTCMSNEKILVTPHVAGITAQAAQNGLEILVANVEAYAAGKPQNVVTKNPA